ncbi:unnamed protein product [Schistosoma mattheei]|uniref:Innexin n=1 Tax=Schistosoma mattheei TaxID=31246 RepID=A0AA85BEK7_9TREM|nr:unnamed protein product [Schistosoma mattheei]
MRSAIRLNCAETDSSQLITYGLARYIDNVIYHRSYKQWRIHSPKIKSHLKHKSSQNHSMIKSTQKSTSHTSSSTTLTSTSHDIGTETKFVKFDNESLPTKQTSNPCKTLPNESMVSRSYKKQPAPQPPVTTTNSTTTTTTSITTTTTTTTSTTTTTTTTTVITTNTTTTTTAVMVTTKNSLKVNSDQIIYTSSPILKSTSNVIQSKLNSLSSKQNDHRKFYSPICNTCGLCFNNLSIIDRKIKTRSIQSLVTTSTITEISPPPPSASSSSSSSSSSPPPPPTTTTTPIELTTGAILFNSKNSSKLQCTQSTLNPFQHKSSSSSSSYWSYYNNNKQQSMKSNKQSLLHNYQSKSKIFSIKNTFYQLIYNLGLFLRCFLTLLCLLPTCLFHWLLCGNGVSGGGGGGGVGGGGNQKIKRIQRSHSFLFYLYVTIKLLYLINIIGQIYLMQIFLGVKSYFFGIYVLKDLIYGNIWSETGHFPRVTYCDFEAKKLGKNYKYTLQCVLPLNLFLEKVYVFLWFWYLFIGLLTFYSLIKWLLRLTLPKKRIKFIKKFLYSYQSINQSINQSIKQSINLNQFKLFINQYLNLDGIFVLWLLSMNMNDIMMNDLIRTLWNLFLTRLYTIQSITLSKINNPCIDPMNDHQKKSSYLYQSINRNQSNLLFKSIINEQNDYINNNNQLSNDHFIKSLKKYPITKSYSKSFLYNNDHIDSIFYLNNNNNDPFIYSKQFHSCCQPVTKYGETMNVTTNNSNNNNNMMMMMNTCHSTDIFESSDSIV